MYIRLELVIVGISIIGVYLLIEDDVIHFLEKDRKIYSLVIPSIRFNMDIYDMDSRLNDVDYNIEILDSSNLESNLFFIAGHSGGGDNCYFNRVKELKSGDYVYLKNSSEMLVFEIVDRYFIVKNGNMMIDEEECNVLYLVTCDMYNGNKQFIMKGILVN